MKRAVVQGLGRSDTELFLLARCTCPVAGVRGPCSCLNATARRRSALPSASLSRFVPKQQSRSARATHSALPRVGERRRSRTPRCARAAPPCSTLSACVCEIAEAGASDRMPTGRRLGKEPPAAILAGKSQLESRGPAVFAHSASRRASFRFARHRGKRKRGRRIASPSFF